MAKFNTTATRSAVGNGPVVSEPVASGVTHEGAPGFARSAKSELFLLAVTNMVGEATFYEPAGGRDSRYTQLVAQVATEDPGWLARFLPWLRNEANMRSASLVGALDAALAMLAAKQPGARQIIANVLQRADEPGEALAYWTSRYGRAIPKPVKRGIADAVQRLYTEYNLLKYDTANKGYRFADVIDLVHPEPRAPWQGDLYRYALDRRHNRGNDIPGSLVMVETNRALRQAVGEGRITDALLDANALKAAGFTWEDALSLAGDRLDKAALWSALIPGMGYMALLRNLRNFDQAGVPDAVAQTVAARLADPEQVAKSRQLPMRFLSAYRAAPSLRWSYPLEQAIGYCLANITELPGRTLILVDVSGSMNDVFSKDGTLRRWDAATIFGVALALRCAHADVIAYDDRVSTFEVRRGESLLRALDRWRAEGHFRGSGTYTTAALRATFAKHDRVVILTDEQAAYDGDPGSVIPATVPLYTWNLAGYRYGHAPSGRNRWAFGGLTDQGFKMIPLLESGREGAWPF